MKRSIIILVLALHCVVNISGQNIPFIRFSEEDGLAGNSVQDILRDKNDFLWIATEGGLSKYDGSTFRNLEKTGGLPNNMVWALSAGDGDQVYAGCYGGGLAEILGDTVTRIFYTRDRFPNSIRNLFYSKAFKTLFAGTDNGLYVLNDTALIHLPLPKDTTLKSSVLAIIEYNNRIFYTIHGLANRGLYELFYNQADPVKSLSKYISHNGIFSLTIQDDTLFCSDYHVVYANPLDKITGQITYARIDSQFLIWNMIPYGRNELLLGGYDDGRFSGDISILDRKTRRANGDPFKIDANSVFSTFADTISDILYLGTDNGLYCIKNSPVTYTEFRNISDTEYFHDSLYVLTDEAVYCYSDNTFTLLWDKQDINKIIEARFRENKNLKLYTDTYNSFELNGFVIDNEQLMLQTSGGSLSIPSFSRFLPIGTGTFKSIDKSSGYVQAGYIELRLYEDLSRMDKYHPLSYNGRPVDNITEILEEKNVLYLISRVKGLTIIKNRVPFIFDESNSVIGNNLSDIDKSGDGSVWISSAHGNLYEIVYSDSLVVKRTLNQQKGNFTGTKIKWIKFTPQHLWIATDKGLNMISAVALNSENPKPDFFINENNGYPFINAMSPVVGEGGKLFMHDSERLILVDAEIPEKPNSAFYYPEIIINNKSSDVLNLKSKRHPASTRRIQITFSLKKYPSARNLRYRYKINSNPWVAGNQVVLQSLKPGKYTVVVEAEDIEFSTVSSDEISFSIASPLAYRWWFILLSAMLFLTLTSFIFLQRIRAIRKEHDEKTLLITDNSELRLRSLLIQMSPHFIFNALNSIQYCIVNRNTDEALHYLSNLAKIIRSNLENANEEFISLSDEVAFLEKYISLERFRFGADLNVQIDNRVDSSLSIPPMLIQPILENAIQHGIKDSGGSGIVTVEFIMDGEILKIIVTDNGKGRNESNSKGLEKNKSLGISTIRKRLELLNKKFKTTYHSLTITELYSENKRSGTRVELTLMALRK